MTKLLEQAVDALRRLSPDAQDAYARALLEILPSGEVYKLTSEDRVAIEVSRAQMRRGEFVSEREMEEFWRGYGA
ncbi:MAG: hypothetical protein KIT67_25440 [Alphaproteobacteria bacterium]|nr:hypothetical protein [Alphaproteobacteria bacterium]